jgi:uncharacterized protein YlaI
METTHGWYDRGNLYFANALRGMGLVFTPYGPLMFILAELVPDSKSYRPMNLYYNVWKKLCDDYHIDEHSLKSDPLKNIELGAILLKRISERIKNPTIEKIATIYNFIGAEKVTDYGARVGVIYREKLWEKHNWSKFLDVRGGY